MAVTWDITGDEVNEANIRGFGKKDIDFNVNNVNKIAKKMQYLSQHRLNIAKLLTPEVKIAYFNSYAKSRMDFLADIATATPTMENSKLFYGELLAGIDKNRILLDRISGIDNFKYRINLHDCRHCDKNQCFLDNCRKEISLENDIAVGIPNDIIGQHAFYIIIENLIRNTAKHSAKVNNELVSFHIEVRTPDYTACIESPELKSYYEIHIYDDIVVTQNEEEFKIDDKEFFKENGLGEIGETSVDNIEKIDHLEKLVYRQNMLINQPLLDKENKLRQGAWGMLEMEASAAYLRKIPVENIDNEEYDLQVNDLFGKDYNMSDKKRKSVNILKAFIKETKYRKRHLAYRFFMLKPKEILVVADDDAIAKMKDENDGCFDLKAFSSSLINYGICMKYRGSNNSYGIEQFVEEVKNERNEILTKAEIYEHEILLNLTQNEIESNAGVLPDRIVNVDLAGELAKINANNVRRFKENVWKEYNHVYLSNIYIHPFKYHNETYSFFDNRTPQQNTVAYYDHHAFSNRNSNLSTILKHVDHWEPITGLTNMAEVLVKAASIVTNNNNKDHDKIVFHKLLSSVCSQIIVLDERIQEASPLTYKPEGSEKTISFKELYIASGIYVPPKDIFNFSAISYPKEDKESGTQSAREQVKSLLSNVNAILLDNEKTISFERVNFLIVHLGVLEKILNAEDRRLSVPNKEEEVIFSLVQELVSKIPNSKHNNTKVIIISGRGLPPNLPSELSFVNYSALSQYLIDNRNKFLLNELLFSTRKISK